MASFVIRGSILSEILIAVACLLAACVQTPASYAQRVGHPSSGGHVGAPRALPPPASHAPISQPRVSQPRVSAGPPPVGSGIHTFPFGPHPIHVFRPRVFFGPTFFRYGLGLGVDYFWWETWNPLCVWGLTCNVLPPYEYGFENYVTLPPYANPPYLYAQEERALVWLYLKDGTVYGVNDYWFVNGQIHFIIFEEVGAKLLEHVIAFDELDLQKTVDVNTRRGFRVVMRDAPMEQYLRDHPDLTPPLLQPPQKNP